MALPPVVERGAEAARDLVAIVGMDAVLPPAERGRLVGGAQDAAGRVGPAYLVAQHVEVPDRVAGGERGEPVTLLEPGARGLGGALVGDILGHAIPAADHALLVDPRAGTRDEGAVRTVGDAHAEFGP